MCFLPRRAGRDLTLRIYGHVHSINVRKVLWACSELGLSFEQEDWGGPHRATSESSFLRLNPAGQIPAIDDGGMIVWESNVIVRYLAATRGRVDLLPSIPGPRARIEMWMDWQASDFNNSWRAAFQGLVRRNPEFQQPVNIERSLAAVSSSLAVVDAQLASTGGYICGATFSAADIPMGLSIHRCLSLPASLPRFESVERYYQRLCERAGFVKYGREGGP